MSALWKESRPEDKCLLPFLPFIKFFQFLLGVLRINFVAVGVDYGKCLYYLFHLIFY